MKCGGLHMPKAVTHNPRMPGSSLQAKSILSFVFYTLWSKQKNATQVKTVHSWCSMQVCVEKWGLYLLKKKIKLQTRQQCLNLNSSRFSRMWKSNAAKMIHNTRMLDSISYQAKSNPCGASCSLVQGSVMVGVLFNSEPHQFSVMHVVAMKIIRKKIGETDHFIKIIVFRFHCVPIHFPLCPDKVDSPWQQLLMAVDGPLLPCRVSSRQFNDTLHIFCCSSHLQLNSVSFLCWW